MTTETELDHKFFAAIERLGRALGGARRQLASDHRLSLLGVSAMEALADGQGRQVGALAAELAVSQPTISDALTTLEQRGLVERRRDPDDLRRSLVSLSPQGEVTSTEMARAMAPLLSTSSDQGTPDARPDALRLLLAQIARLQDAGIISRSRTCLTCDHYRAPEPSHPARCLLLDAPLPDADLRLDCGEHVPVAV